ncbi:YhdP family protein [Stagnihabitans tardus]|uniref:AsmA-like C-terminal domain-containing protein n=1 Tax=Stagnihabitans tardus TaxID=2699202 RepID=A0AAE4YB96_9RHOB|nr:DUF3971 domain-containing protein [Stagnihabitans tardus]NBZ87104.1 hypothetical protein [Stagnihabitans tardus]
MTATGKTQTAGQTAGPSGGASPAGEAPLVLEPAARVSPGRDLSRAEVPDTAPPDTAQPDTALPDAALPDRRKADLGPPGGRERRRRRRSSGLGGRLVFLFLVAALGLGLLALNGRTIPLPVWAVAEIESRLNDAIDRVLPQHAASVGGITLTVGSDWTPTLDIEDLRLLQPSGQTLLTLPESHLQLDPGSLLHGAIQPQSLRIVGARLAVRRDADGRFDLDLGSAGSAPAPRLESPAQAFALLEAAFAQPAFAHLTRIDVEALSLTLTDRATNRTWEVGDGRLSIDNRPEELAAQLAMTLVAGGETPAQAVLTAVLGKGKAEARLSAEVTQVSAPDLASGAPALAWLGVLDAPISGRLAATIGTEGVSALEGRLEIGAGALQPTPGTTPIAFDRASLGLGFDPQAGRLLLTDLSLQSQTLRLKAKGQAYMVDAQGQRETGPLSARIPAAFLGQLTISDLSVDPDGLFAAPVQFSEGAFDARLRLDPFTLDIGQFTLAEAGDTLSLKGRISASPKGWTTAIDLNLNRISRDRLLAIWPLRLVTGTRNWVRDNIRNAQLKDLTAALRLAPGQEPRAELSYSFADAELRFMPKMPQVTGADGYSTIQGRRYTLVVSKGQIRPPEGGLLDVSGTVFAVPDITLKPAVAEIGLRLRGPLTATLSLLDQPPLSYMRKAGQPVDLGTGNVDLTARISFPLIARVLQEHVTLDVRAVVRDFLSDKLIKDHRVTAPALDVHVTSTQLTIAGKGAVGQVPFDMTLSQVIPISRLTPRQASLQANLPQGVLIFPEAIPAPPTLVAGTVTLSPAAVEEFRLGLPKTAVQGEGPAEVVLTLAKGQPGRMELTSTLEGLVLAIPELGWRKGAGTAGTLKAEVTLGTVPRVDRLALSAPGLSAEGTVTLRSDGLLDLARFSRVKMGGWLDGGLDIKGNGSKLVEFAVTSGSIDMRRFPENRGGGGSGGNRIRADLASLRVTEGIRIAPFSGDFTLRGGFNGTFRGRVNGEAPITGTVVPTRNGSAVRIEADDAGAVARSAGLFASAQGGKLTLSLVPLAGSGIYDGTARIERVRVKYGSFMADLLSAISVVGLLDQLNGDGIVFDRAEAEFLLTPSVIEIRRGSAIGLSMGVSLEGRYDTGSTRFDMQGVVSPLYLLNGIGAILTRKGEGLFGFAYKLRGTAAVPDVSVNPLSILTPGMFRELFRAPAPNLGNGG